MSHATLQTVMLSVIFCSFTSHSSAVKYKLYNPEEGVFVLILKTGLSENGNKQFLSGECLRVFNILLKSFNVNFNRILIKTILVIDVHLQNARLL